RQLNAFGAGLLILQAVIYACEVKASCDERQGVLSLLDVAEDSVFKVKGLVPDCAFKRKFISISRLSKEPIAAMISRCFGIPRIHHCGTESSIDGPLLGEI
ncbi:hypothetical protein NPIL_134151, partial [Nephila pilipes]